MENTQTLLKVLSANKLLNALSANNETVGECALLPSPIYGVLQTAIGAGGEGHEILRLTETRLKELKDKRDKIVVWNPDDSLEMLLDTEFADPADCQLLLDQEGTDVHTYPDAAAGQVPEYILTHIVMSPVAPFDILMHNNRMQ